MSANLIDAGDIQRLEREKNLVKDVPTIGQEEPAVKDNFFDRFAEALVRRLLK